MRGRATDPVATAEPWDVVVVGARMAGAATAMLLARHGRRVLVLDRSRRGADTLSTHALMRTGTVLLHRWGLLDRVVSAQTPPVRRTEFHYGDEVVPISLQASFGVDALYAPRRHLADDMLVGAAVEAGATARFGLTVTGLLRDESGQVVGVTAVDRSGGALHIPARLVVGADGRQSTVADHAGAQVLHAGSSAGGYLYGYWTGFDTESYEWFYRPGAAGGAIPTNDGQTCVFVGEPAPRLGERLVAGPTRAFADLSASIGPALTDRLAAAQQSGRLRVFRGRPSFLRQSAGRGWALVGDAGQWKDPISTHGMSDALRDAELLARAVLAREPGPRGQDHTVAGYQRQRDDLCRPMIAVTDRIASYDWDLSQVRQLVRELSSTMADQVEAVARLESSGTAA